jgi:hypothetical protein
MQITLSSVKIAIDIENLTRKFVNLTELRTRHCMLMS